MMMMPDDTPTFDDARHTRYFIDAAADAGLRALPDYDVATI